MVTPACPVARRDCDGPGTYHCDAEVWGSACHRHQQNAKLLPVLRGPLAGRYVDTPDGVTLVVPTTPETRYALRSHPSLDGTRWAYYWLPEADGPDDLTTAELDQLAGYVARSGRPMPAEQVESAARTATARLVRALDREASPPPAVVAAAKALPVTHPTSTED